MVLIWLMVAALGKPGDYQVVYGSEPITLWGAGCAERLRTNLRLYLQNDKIIRVSAKKVFVASAEGPVKPFWSDHSGATTTLKYQWDAYSPMLITINWTKLTIRIAVSRKFEERNCGVSWTGSLKYIADGIKARAAR